jgi:hypothetical protein
MTCVFCDRELEQPQMQYCSRICKKEHIGKMLLKPRLSSKDILSLLK